MILTLCSGYDCFRFTIEGAGLIVLFIFASYGVIRSIIDIATFSGRRD
jgi:hypothetical protein